MKSLVTILLVLTLWSPPLAEGAPTNDGIYADMQTSMGTIELELFYTNTPRTVANFISLCEGTRSWVDFIRGGVSSNRFYQSNIFHRVVSNFVIQAGSPNMLGNDSPGYHFDDEFDGSLIHVPGVLSMANSGPDTNGSQFFIPVIPTHWLDGVHSIFGQVVGGMDVVSNINHVMVYTNNNRPVVDVVIEDITITRNGAAANAFSITNVSPALPRVRAKESRLNWSGSDLIMGWDQLAGAQYWVLGNENLLNSNSWFSVTTWSGAASNLNISAYTYFYPSYFFTAIEVEY
jgi:peptidyl-prolyl cis-trans isomerase A (cyclophilin A)